jgi:hypothetical protein
MEEMNDRPYRMEDVEAIATAIMRRERFLDHKDDFIAYDPDFAPPFADDWQTLIELSYQQDADEYVLIDQTDLTKAVNEAIQQGRASMVDLRFFAQKAFGTKGLYKVFNFKAHDRMTRQPANYIIYLRVQHALALQFATQLSVKGMTPAQMGRHCHRCRPTGRCRAGTGALQTRTLAPHRGSQRSDGAHLGTRAGPASHCRRSSMPMTTSSVADSVWIRNERAVVTSPPHE